MRRLALLLLSVHASLTCALLHGSAGSGGRDSTDPEWQAAKKKFKEISDLSDEIDSVEKRIQYVYNKYTREKNYYDSKIDNLETQIKIRKKTAKSLPSIDDPGYREEQERHFTSLMCFKLIDAFVTDSQDARVGVMEICMGRVSLGLGSLLQAKAERRSSRRLRGEPWAVSEALGWSAALRGVAAADRQADNLTEVVSHNLTEAVLDLGADIGKLFAVESRLDAGGRRSPSLREKLEKLKQEDDRLFAKLQADKARWQQEVEELQKLERSLGDQHWDHHIYKTEIRKAAQEKVTEEMCAVVHNFYAVDEPKIVAYVEDKC